MIKDFFNIPSKKNYKALKFLWHRYLELTTHNFRNIFIIRLDFSWATLIYFCECVSPTIQIKLTKEKPQFVNHRCYIYMYIFITLMQHADI